MAELAEYAKAMRNGNYYAALRIEQRNGVAGYPPELVSVALKAIDEGKSGWTAINEYIQSKDPTHDA